MRECFECDRAFIAIATSIRRTPSHSLPWRQVSSCSNVKQMQIIQGLHTHSSSSQFVHAAVCSYSGHAWCMRRITSNSATNHLGQSATRSTNAVTHYRPATRLTWTTPWTLLNKWITIVAENNWLTEISAAERSWPRWFVAEMVVPPWERHKQHACKTLCNVAIILLRGSQCDRLQTIKQQ
jgi:hypothetical protein